MLLLVLLFKGASSLGLLACDNACDDAFEEAVEGSDEDVVENCFNECACVR